MSGDKPASQANTVEEVVKKIDPQNLAQEIVRALQEADHSKLWVSREEHAAQHEFLKHFMEREKRKQEKWDRIKERAAGTAIVSGIFTFLGWIGKQAIDIVNNYIMKVMSSGSPPSHH